VLWPPETLRRLHDQPFALQVQVHRIQNLAAQLVLLQQMTEAQDRRLVRRRCAPQIDAGKAPQHQRLIKSPFHPRVNRLNHR
jgi:hypothetical protein